MPKVVFWSPIIRMTGNTLSSIAVSTLMSEEEDVNCILLHAHWLNRKIESSFEKYEDLKNKNAFNDSNIGMTALSRLSDSNKLIPESIRNYSVPVIKQKLDIIYGTNVTTREQFAALSSAFPAIVRKADEAYDFVMVDLPKGTDNDYIREVLEDADLIVCTINQDTPRLDEFFQKLDSNEIIKDKNKIIVVGDYENKSKYNLFNLKGKYKCKYPMFAVPHNYIFMDHCNDGDATGFFFKNAQADKRDYNGYFMDEVRQIVKKIIELTKGKDL